MKRRRRLFLPHPLWVDGGWVYGVGVRVGRRGDFGGWADVGCKGASPPRSFPPLLQRFEKGLVEVETLFRRGEDHLV